MITGRIPARNATPVKVWTIWKTMINRALADHDADPAKQFEAQEDERESQGRLQSFKQAVAGLPERQRLALTLQLAGYSLKPSPNTCRKRMKRSKSHLRYAKNKLKRVLVENQEQDMDMLEACNG